MMSNRVSKILGIRKPIIQGPLFWLTDAKLVAAVSNAGGLGVLGYNAGQTTVTRDIDETVARMRREIAKVRALTDKPFGINYAASDEADDPFAQPMFDLIVAEHIPVVVFAGTVAPGWFAKLHEQNIKIVYRALNPSARDAKQAEAAGADIIVATGFDEGGTVPDKVVGTFSIVPMIVDAVDRTPVIAAGGISDARTAKAAYALGAEGLYVGTAFMLSEESRLAENIKQQALGADADDLLLYRDEPAFYRSLPGTMPNRLATMSEQGASRAEINTAHQGMHAMREGMLLGDLENGIASFGLGISLIHRIESVATIMQKLDVAEAD